MISTVKFICKCNKTTTTKRGFRTFLYKTRRIPEVRACYINQKYPTRVVIKTPTVNKTAYTIYNLSKQYNVQVSNVIHTRAASYRFYQKTKIQRLPKRYPSCWNIFGLLSKLYNWYTK
jgi:hypothetical protein